MSKGIDEILKSTNRSVNSAIRSVSIPVHFYKKRARVYNGKSFIFFSIKHSMLGRKFGEFSITKFLGSQTLRKKKKKRKNK